MDDDLSLSRIIEEIRLLLLQESFFLHEMKFMIELIINELCEQNRLIESILPYARSNSFQMKRMKKLENEAIETAINAKKAIEKLVVQKAVQNRRGTLQKKVFFVKDRKDYLRDANKLNDFFLHIRRTMDKFIEEEGDFVERKDLKGYSHGDDDDDNSDDVNYDDDIVGREEDIDTIKTKLTSETAEDSYLIYIDGDEGIGKTVVARKVYYDIHVRSHFDCFAWITHSGKIYQFTPLFLKDILGQLTMGMSPSLQQNDHQTTSIVDEGAAAYSAIASDDDNDVEILKRRLYDFLKDKRYLIVLDDFDINKEWEKFFIRETSPTSRGLEGSRVLLASNIKENISWSRISYLHNLQPLNEANSWEMFIKKVSDTELLQFPDLESIAKQVVGKCNGVPLLILGIAKQLSDIENTYSAWLHFLNTQIKRSERNDQHKIISSVPKHLQQCISYLQFFPKNFDIPVRRLFALWIAEEMVTYTNFKTDEQMAMYYLQQLIDMKIVQVTRTKVDGSPKTCSLNKIWHQGLVSKMNQQNNHEESTTISYSSTIGIRQLPVYHSRVLSNKQLSFDSCRFLLSFLCFDYRRSYEPSRQVKDFLRRGINKDCFLSLKVLDLEGVYKPVLPKEIKRLKNLRYLGLRWTYIDELPSFIGDLFNLQTLDVKHTYINTFPKWIHKLKHLQHLYMSENHRGKFVYRRTKAAGDPPLAKLETLWGIFIDEDSHLKNGLDRLTNIRKLGIMYRLSISQKQDAVAQWLLKLEELESLRLKSKDQHDKPSVLSLKDFNNHRKLSKMYLLGDLKKERLHQHSFPPCLKKLTLSASKLHDDPMPILGMLPTLAILRLYSDSYVGLRMHCSSSSFVQLKVLKMWKLVKLEEWIVDKGSMPILEELDIRSCIGLNMLPAELQQITAIREIKLANMSETFTEQVKLDKSWSIKDNLYFADEQVDFPKKNAGTLVANDASASSSLSSSSFSSSLGSVVLLFLLARRGGVLLTPTPTKHAKAPIGLSFNSSLAS